MTGVSERLDAIEARKNAATPGPWRTWKDNDGQRGAAVETAWAHDSDGADTELITDWCTPPDAVFIAHAPQDITDLLVLARKQQAALDALNDWCGRNKTGFYDEAQDDVVQIIRASITGEGGA